jgi:phytoene dehydrogenase-like protein
LDGTLIRSQRVVSSAHPVTTYLSLIGTERLPGDVVRDVERYRTRSGSVKLNVALSELPEFPSWEHETSLHRGLVAISPSIEYLERAWDDAKYGRMSEHPYVEVVFPTAHEPDGLAPDGKHLMLGFAQYGPYDLAEGSWDDGGRDEFARRVFDGLGEYAPKLKDSIEQVEVLAPKDIEDRLGLVGGNIMQGELTPDQLFGFRPITGYGDYRTPVGGMYLCGSGTHPGGGVMGVPGRNAASVVLRDHKRGEFVDRIKNLGR